MSASVAFPQVRGVTPMGSSPTRPTSFTCGSVLTCGNVDFEDVSVFQPRFVRYRAAVVL